MATDLEETHVTRISARLTAVRQATGKNQSQFADFAGIGETTWNNYETGFRRISLDEAFKVCRVTGVTLDWIYFGDRGGLPLHIAEQLSETMKDAG